MNKLDEKKRSFTQEVFYFGKVAIPLKVKRPLKQEATAIQKISYLAVIRPKESQPSSKTTI